jgi:mRNA-degrading endonuclease RelE of RelBE toxin-antitoxin system
MVFVETPLFTRIVHKYLSDDEFAALQWGLTLHPEAGDIIPGTGGVRKMRWAGSGRGKRGGLRVIYYWRDRQGEIWLLTIYAKNEAQNIPPHILREFKRELEDG